MEINGAIGRVCDAFEFSQNGITRLVDFLPVMRRDHIGEQVEASTKLSVGFLLIESGKPAITGNISVEDGGKLAFHRSVSDTGGIKINRRISSNPWGSLRVRKIGCRAKS